MKKFQMLTHLAHNIYAKLAYFNGNLKKLQPTLRSFLS